MFIKQNSWNNIFNDFLNLIYPRLCYGCYHHLVGNEKVLCSKCIYDMPLTHYCFEENNALEQLFWGRVKVEKAVAYYHYRKGSRYQDLLHLFKYRGKMEIGYELGRMLGKTLSTHPHFLTTDVLVPVPLHWKKEKKRGFNQSEIIAKGINQVLNKQLILQNVKRNVDTSSQTSKSRYERWQNVENIFTVQNKDLFRNKHVLLIDDVVTTGATLEAMAAVIQEIENTKISIAALAVADFA